MDIYDVPEGYLKPECNQCWMCKWWKPISIYAQTRQQWVSRRLKRWEVEHARNAIFEGHCYRYPPQFIREVQNRPEEWPEWYNPPFVYLRPITKAYDRCGEFLKSDEEYDDYFNRKIGQPF